MIDDLEQLTYLDQEGRWKGLQAIGMVVSERRIGLEVTTETRYYLLSFAREVQRFATSIRSHWGIEIACIGCLMSLFGRMSRAFALDMLITIWPYSATWRSIFFDKRRLPK